MKCWRQELLAVIVFSSNFLAADEMKPKISGANQTTVAPSKAHEVSTKAVPPVYSAAAGKPPEKLKYVLVRPEDAEWVDGPPALPKGSRMIVLDGNMKNSNLFAIRLKFPAGYQIFSHWNDSDEHITVISGILHIGVGEKFDTALTTAVTPGSYVMIPAKTHYYIWSPEETVIQINDKGPWSIHYLHLKDDPRATK